MKKNLTTLLLASCLGSISYAQDAWLPDHTFAPGANAQICDNSPWKLIFFDDFKGTTLDDAKWVTFTPWLGMNCGIPDHDCEPDEGVRKSGFYKDANDNDQWNAAILAQNVVVSNGTVKLKVKNEPVTIAGETKYYSAGQIATRYHYMGQKKAFNSGKFEVRMKMPVFTKAHTTLWTWYGSAVGINEIDMAESYGPDRSGQYGGSPFTFKHYKTSMYYPTHAWGFDPELNPTAPLVFPYHTDKNASQHPVSSVQYPRQRYINWLGGNYLHLDEWHTYTCEWDTTLIRFYLDEELVHTMWKYYRYVNFFADNGVLYRVKSGSGCNPTGTHSVTYGFPYRRDNSNCNFRISTGVNGIQGPATSGVTDLGEAEIDYVKIYQRHPELDGYSEICNGTHQITGPGYVCGTAAFSISPAVNGGTWSVNNNSLNISGFANQGSTVFVQNNTANPVTSNTALLQYQFTPNGCPTNQVSKLVQNGTVSNQVVSCFQNIFLSKMDLSLQVLNPQAGATYEWVINYSHPISGNFTYHAYGASVRTPRFMHWTLFYYSVNWSLKVTNACGQRMFYGSKNALNMAAPTYGRPDTYRQEDGSAIYLQTRMMTESDSLDLERNVFDMVAEKMVEDATDSISVNSMIVDAYMANLEPYIYFDDMDNTDMRYDAALPFPQMAADKSMLFPNPVHDRITVLPSKHFTIAEEVAYRIIDINGAEVVKGLLPRHGTLDVSRLQTGLYILEMRQQHTTEQVKFSRQ